MAAEDVIILRYRFKEKRVNNKAFPHDADALVLLAPPPYSVMSSFQFSGHE
jgi:hypothetical protein